MAQNKAAVVDAVESEEFSIYIYSPLYNNFTLSQSNRKLLSTSDDRVVV